MNVKGIKDIIEQMELSLEAVTRIDEILAEFGEGEVSNEVIDKILKIVDIEMDATKLTADIYQAGADMADEFLKTVDDEANKIADEIETPVNI